MMTLIHSLRRWLGERVPSGEAAARVPSADRFFTSRLKAGGNARVLPPEGLGGYIGPEPQARIPFRLGAGDGEVKIVAFSDPPGLLSLAVEKPDGTLLAAADADFGAEWTHEGATTTCSFALPAGKPGAGTWQVVLAVDTWRFKAYLMSVRHRFPREFERLAAHGVFYSVSALAAPRPSPPPREPQAIPRAARLPRRWAAAHPAL